MLYNFRTNYDKYLAPLYFLPDKKASYNILIYQKRMNCLVQGINIAYNRQYNIPTYLINKKFKIYIKGDQI